MTPDDVRRRARERQRACRRRQRNGHALYQVEAGGAVLDMLIRLRWLPENDANNDRRVAQAIANLLADAAQR
jgi:hypothetical protein